MNPCAVGGLLTVRVSPLDCVCEAGLWLLSAAPQGFPKESI